MYNFAATFPVDFAFEDTRRLLLVHMLSVTPLFAAAILFIAISSGADATWLVQRLKDGSVLESTPFTVSLCAGLVVMGVLSLTAYFVHWKVSVGRLYDPPEPSEEPEEATSWLTKVQFWRRNRSSEC